MTREDFSGSSFDFGFTLKNTAAGFVLTIILLFIVSVISVLFTLPDAIIKLLVSAITYLSIGVCGFRAARHLGKGGLISGLIAGLIYIVLLYVIGGLITSNFSLSPSALITVLLCLVSGAIGGLIGINTKHKKRR